MNALCRKWLGLFYLLMFPLEGIYAAPPTTFDNWNENAGAITAACPASFECIDGVNDNGILQRTLRAANGDEYIQLIVVGQENLTGSLVTDESFIQVNSGGMNGISSKQTINQTGADQLNSQTILNTGWANTGGAAVDIRQSLNTSYQGAGYSDSFVHITDQDANGNVTGTYTDISQTMLNSAQINGITPTGRDVQRFVTRRASGSRTASGGSATLPAAAGGQMGGMMGGGGAMGDGMQGGGAGGTVNWNAGDDVQVTWIGLLCEGCGSDGMMPGGGGGGGGGGGMGGGVFDATFSYQAFDNMSDGSAAIATASVITTDPFTWPNPPFGAQPALP